MRASHCPRGCGRLCVHSVSVAQGTRVAGSTAEVSMANNATCPVCGMSVDSKTAPSTQFQGQTYYFCSNECKTKFLANPTEYVKEPISRL
jgi:Cu+-exporting ATPase